MPRIVQIARGSATEDQLQTSPPLGSVQKRSEPWALQNTWQDIIARELGHGEVCRRPRGIATVLVKQSSKEWLSARVQSKRKDLEEEHLGHAV